MSDAVYLADNSDAINTMTMELCEDVLTKYHGKRSAALSVIRPLLKNRIKVIKDEIKTEQKRIKSEQKAAEKLAKKKTNVESTIIMRLMAFYGQYVLPSLVNTVLTQLQVKARGRSIGNNIFDLPDVFTGYESEASIKMREMVEGYKPCMEHFNPRQWNGERISAIICEYIECGEVLTFFEWANIIHASCFVHKVTSEENQRLIEFQKSHLFEGPEASYEAAGIKLIKVDNYEPHENWTLALKMIEENDFTHHEVVNNLCHSMFSLRKAMEMVRSDGDREEVAMQVLELLEEIAEFEVLI
jgi:hypothetical protein